MTCPYEKWLSQYIDGELPPEKRNQIRTHLDSCDICRTEYNTLTGLDIQLRSLPEIEPSEGFERAFWKKVADWEERKERSAFRAFFGRGWRPYVVSGMAALMIVFGLHFFNLAAPAPTPEDVMMAEQMDLLLDYDIISHLELLENWEAITAVGEPS